MTQRQIEFPKYTHTQVQTTPSVDLIQINDRLRTLSDAHNNIPGVGEWLYVGKHVPFLNTWANYRTFDPTFSGAVRFRRTNYDEVQIEGLARQAPYFGGTAPIFRLPEGFIPGHSKMFRCPTDVFNADTAGAYRVDIFGFEQGANAGIVQINSAIAPANINYLSFDGVHFSLIRSAY